MTRVAYLQTRLLGSSVFDVRRAVELAEDAGLDGLGVGDHVSFYGGAGADGLVGATCILAASGRLAAVVGVYLLPLRHPVLVARQVADIATLTPGRLVLGVGIGGEDPHEIEVCGVGQCPIPTAVSRRPPLSQVDLAERDAHADRQREESLTPTELDVGCLVAEGLTSSPPLRAAT